MCTGPTVFTQCLLNAGSRLGWQGWSGALVSLRKRQLLGGAEYRSIREQSGHSSMLLLTSTELS